MKTVPELLDERKHAVRSMEDIVKKAETEDRALTQEEHVEIAELHEKVHTLDRRIAEVEAFEAAKQTTVDLVKTLNEPRKRQTTPEKPKATADDPPPSAREAVTVRPRYGVLKAFVGQDAEERAYRSGMWLRGALFGDDHAKRWCHNHGMEFRAESRALAEGTNTAGGFLVPEEMLTAIIDLREKHGVFRRECRVVPMGRDVMTVPRVTGNASATFVDENTALTESDATWDNVQLTAKKLGVLTRVSSELAEDAVIDLADWVARDFAWAFAKKEDQCGFIGDGSSTYGGMTGITQILNGSTSTHTAGSQDAASGNDDFIEIDLADLNTLMGVVPAYALEGGNCKWYCSQVANALVFDRLKAAGGGNTITDLAGRIQPTMLGYPIVITQILPTTTTAAALNDEAMLLFGDLSQSSTLGDRRQIAVSVSTDRYFVEDQIAIKATERFHIVNHDLGNTSTAGPLVALVGQT